MNTALQTRVRERMNVLTRHSDARELDPVLEAIGGAEVVLLGEATHGTREFYRYRTRISQRLIAERGFDAIAVEADWPDALVVDRHVRGGQDSAHGDDARQALSAFERFPRWMWRNEETVSLVRWLGTHNGQQDASHRCGFFGLDLYSLRRSMQAVVAYLEQVDPEAAHRARHRYACFDHLADDPQRYGYTTSFGLRPDCEDAVVEQLMQMERQDYGQLAAGDHDEAFFAEQNARVAQNAEAYYRAMFQGRHTSWNLRDTHMADTLAALRDHLSSRKDRPARIVVWAHNSHIGDARATEMGEGGQINLGQLVRERIPKSYLLGFTTYAGHVCAASDWDGLAEHKRLLPARPDSVEHLLHTCHPGAFFLPLRTQDAATRLELGRHLERAVGVIYLPDNERLSHYFEADLAHQFDGVLHVDTTHAVTPLDRDATMPELHEFAPETFPSGM